MAGDTDSFLQGKLSCLKGYLRQKLSQGPSPQNLGRRDNNTPEIHLFWKNQEPLLFGSFMEMKGSVWVSPLLNHNRRRKNVDGQGSQFIALKDKTCFVFCILKETKEGEKASNLVLLIALLFENLFGNIWACSCKLPF